MTSRPTLADPQFHVFLEGPRRGRVFFQGTEIANVRAIDVATTLTSSINDVVRSRISIELVGEVIPVVHDVPEPEPEVADEEAPAT